MSLRMCLSKNIIPTRAFNICIPQRVLALFGLVWLDPFWSLAMGGLLLG